jgi:hypothetical protein
MPLSQRWMTSVAALSRVQESLALRKFMIYVRIAIWYCSGARP